MSQPKRFGTAINDYGYRADTGRTLWAVDDDA